MGRMVRSRTSISAACVFTRASIAVSYLCFPQNVGRRKHWRGDNGNVPKRKREAISRSFRQRKRTPRRVLRAGGPIGLLARLIESQWSASLPAEGRGKERQEAGGPGWVCMQVYGGGDGCMLATSTADNTRLLDQNGSAFLSNDFCAIVLWVSQRRGYRRWLITYKQLTTRAKKIKKGSWSITIFRSPRKRVTLHPCDGAGEPLPAQGQCSPEWR